jgi:CRISPR-associated endonuclease/helicase Cas3
VSVLVARWHDRGKSHEVFQRAVADEAHLAGDWAKSERRPRRYHRPKFRHELASALTLLQANGTIPEEHRDLVAYLAASHHGKVRESLRSMPGEVAAEGLRFARGVHEGDVLPAVDLGGGVTAAEVVLSLSSMEMGLGTDGQPSWAERVCGLVEREDLGVFRLAYLEALIRAADRRASAEEERNVKG